MNGLLHSVGQGAGQEISPPEGAVTCRKRKTLQSSDYQRIFLGTQKWQLVIIFSSGKAKSNSFDLSSTTAHAQVMATTGLSYNRNSHIQSPTPPPPFMGHSNAYSQAV